MDRPSAAQIAALASTGPAPATFTNTAGIFYLDSQDFALAAGTTQPPCTFSGSIASGAACEFGLVFNPTESGTRVADFTAAANQVNITTSFVALTGTATGGSTTATTLALAVTTPTSGKPLPNTAFVVTTTLSGGSSPTGTVTLMVNGIIIGEQKAAASLTFSFPNGLPAGLYPAVATYSGDANNSSSTATINISSAGPTASSVVLTVSPTTVPTLTIYNVGNCTLTTAPVALTSCTQVTLTATVTGSATGPTPTTNVEFLDGATVLGTVKVNSAGVATLVYTGAFAEGTHNLTAE